MENAGDNDVWEEILKRVPALSLGQCSCVCKSWYSLILSPHFIASHIKTQTQTQTHPSFTLFRNFTTQEPRKEIYHLVSDSSNPPEFESPRSFPCPFKTHPRSLYFRIVGTINGLIFLSDDLLWYGDTSILWNPLVGKCVHLPKPRANHKLVGVHVSALGFGYDSVTDDYKVVRLCYPQNKDDGLDLTPPFVELYSIKEGKWRPLIAEGVDYCINDKSWSQCFLRGVVHWIAFDRREVDRGFKCNLVLLFDVEKEIFKQMKLPSPLAEVCPFCVDVCEFRGMLAVKHHQRDSTAKFLGDLMCFDLWVKKRYDDGKSWSKMFSFDGELGIQKVLHVTGNGDILGMAVKNKQPELVCYNPETNEMACLPVEGEAGSFFAGSFTESLVLLGSGSPVVSSEEDQIHSHKRRGFIDETGSGSEDEDAAASKDMEWTFNMAIFLAQMRKFRHDF